MPLVLNLDGANWLRLWREFKRRIEMNFYQKHGAVVHQTEFYGAWPEARVRLHQLRSAGYRVLAVDMDTNIVIHITPGRHADLSRLPIERGR